MPDSASRAAFRSYHSALCPVKSPDSPPARAVIAFAGSDSSVAALVCRNKSSDIPVAAAVSRIAAPARSLAATVSLVAGTARCVAATVYPTALSDISVEKVALLAKA
jgi:hypothetical protein